MAKKERVFLRGMSSQSYGRVAYLENAPEYDAGLSA